MPPAWMNARDDFQGKTRIASNLIPLPPPPELNSMLDIADIDRARTRHVRRAESSMREYTDPFLGRI